MYQVFRWNIRVPSLHPKKTHGFVSYEKARQALRKYIRACVRKNGWNRLGFDGKTGWDMVSRNPVNYTDNGYTIRKVA